MSRPGDWNCRTCNHLNFMRRESCQRCTEPRSTSAAVDYAAAAAFNIAPSRATSSPFAFTTGPDVRPGDWYCTLANCGAHNFASRSSCFKCGAPKDDNFSSSDSDMPRLLRPLGFGGGGASTRPGWKSGDWICTRLLIFIYFFIFIINVTIIIRCVKY